MGPYYQTTTQGMGNFFDALYEHPLLMIVFVVVVIAGVFHFWRKKKFQ